VSVEFTALDIFEAATMEWAVFPGFWALVHSWAGIVAFVIGLRRSEDTHKTRPRRTALGWVGGAIGAGNYFFLKSEGIRRGCLDAASGFSVSPTTQIICFASNHRLLITVFLALISGFVLSLAMTSLRRGSRGRTGRGV
jgi:hypothetical protein